MATDRLVVRGIAGMATNFYGTRREVRKQIRLVNVRHGRNIRAIARQLVPKLSGLTESSITDRVSPEGLAVEVFCDPAVYDAAGEPYYPPDVEFGTYKSPAQPFLFPAWEADRPHYLADVSRVVKSAHRKYRVR